MAGISDKALLKQDSKNKFNGGVELEEDYGVNLYSTFYRNYDPQIGRFGGVDAKAEDHSNISSYQFALNNPNNLNDPLGLKEEAPTKDFSQFWQNVLDLLDLMNNNTMYNFSSSEGGSGGASVNYVDFSRGSSNGAWEIKNEWNGNFIQEYRHFVAGVYNAYYKYAGERFTCEDFALNILVTFAAANGLPLVIKNDSDPKGLRSENFSSADDYYSAVASTTAARDLNQWGNVYATQNPQIGDLILLINSEGNAHHVQVITNFTNSEISIAQGNFDPWYSDMFRWSNNPRSTGYHGTDPQTGYYNRSNGNFFNSTMSRSTPGLLNQSSTTFWSWNFEGFNN
jgi:RHS repeat-associated protein